MTQYKYSPKNYTNLKNSNPKVYRNGNVKLSSRSSLNKTTNNLSKYSLGLLNIVFVITGLFSIASLVLIFTPNLVSPKTAKAQSSNPQAVTIVTNYVSQEYKLKNHGKSFLQPITPVEKLKESIDDKSKKEEIKKQILELEKTLVKS